LKELEVEEKTEESQNQNGFNLEEEEIPSIYQSLFEAIMPEIQENEKITLKEPEEVEKDDTKTSAGGKLNTIKKILRSSKPTKEIAEDDTGAILAFLSLLPEESKAEFVSMLMLVIPQAWGVRAYSQYGLSDIKPMKEGEKTITAFATLCTAISLTDKVSGATSKASVLWLAFLDLMLVNAEYGADTVVFQMLSLMPDDLFEELASELISQLKTLGELK
jgi:hypothetical protein